MMRFIAALFLAMLAGASAFGVAPSSRRAAVHQLFKAAGVGAVLAPAVARAELGPDGFPVMKSESTKKTDMSPDEAQCKYGQAGSKAWAEACKRWKSSGGEGYKAQGGKSPGGSYAM
eukprot:CAMPEP_0118851072 /NCGR_PEP_ID=MMETSP1163-20130328/650_1 /TAXON_ID=124430 /ORGANISM="Phaeomonas parva, Strain CCMP2877" /LENGTH=116 /DNA_ID=CAMNT_0006783339 /DNA_START=14 /DNA_END=364 /DNA_ORIENTATION=-